MKAATFGRRRMLSGSLPMALAILTATRISALPLSAAAASGSFVGSAEDCWAPELMTDEEVFGPNPAELAARHAPFRAAFMTWLEQAPRLAHPISLGEQWCGGTDLTVAGLHPDLTISLQDEGTISVFAMWRGMCWPVAEWLVLLHRDATALNGVEPTYDFQPLLAWINGELAAATHLALYAEPDDLDGRRWTKSHLVRDHIRIRDRRPIVKGDRLRHLLPLWDGAAA